MCMKLIAGIILFCGLFCSNYLNAKQKKIVPCIDTKLIKVDSLLWDLKALSKVPEFDVLHEDKVRSLLYHSIDYQGKATQVFAYYSNPDLYWGKKSGRKKYPGVVLVHGGGGNAFKEWVEKWAAKGYAAIAMDLSGNGENGEKLKNGGPDQRDENKFQKIETGSLKDVWTYYAVASVILGHSLLLSFPEVDVNKTCITGISWGGYLTCIVAGLDNRFKAAVPVYGCGYYDEADTFKEQLRQLNPEKMKRWMRYFDPSEYLPFAQQQFLFINGNKDKHYNVVPYHKTYSLIPPDRRTICIKPDMKHGHIEGWAPSEIEYFFESVVNKSEPMIKVTPMAVRDSSITIGFISPTPISSALFYFSNDTISSNEKRQWEMRESLVDSEKHEAICNISKKEYKYGFFFLRDSRNLTFSSEFIIENK